MSEKGRVTPLMEQFLQIKSSYPDALLFFQVGDFYELFFDDAINVSNLLSITLTKRGKHLGEDIPLCGIPLTSLPHHLNKLVRQGYKVAICEQVSKPLPGEIVQRKVSRVLTPGTLLDQEMLDEKKSSYLCAFWPLADRWALVFAEMLSAKIFATSFDSRKFNLLDAELAKFFPDEIVLPSTDEARVFGEYLSKRGYFTSFSKPLQEQPVDVREYFETNMSLPAFSKCAGHKNLEDVFALLTGYLHRFHENFLPLVEQVDLYQADDYLVLDNVTLKNLEVVRSSIDGSRNNTLLSAVDRCKTGMGSRALKKALTFPLKNKTQITRRADFVSQLHSSYIKLSLLGDLLAALPDLERVVGRIALGRSGLSDLLALKSSLLQAGVIRGFLAGVESPLSRAMVENLPLMQKIQDLLGASLMQDPLSNQKIKLGFDPELDQVRNFIENSQQEILRFEQAEIERSGIASLKLKYTDIQGYFFEISSKFLPSVPQDYRLLQSLVGRSRFVNDELKALEFKIVNAQQQLVDVEERVFDNVLQIVRKEASQLRKIAYTLAQLDMIYSFAKLAYDENYCRPVFVEEEKLEIKQGRHPVIEQSFGVRFVPNDTFFDMKDRLMILTGPNMGGKSTYLRQVAHIALLAHVGAFVPAASCTLSVVDRIFTRIGSGDDLIAGKSTFFVEMEEVSLICGQASKSSLVILDEVGRGTSTYDGMAIAHAILEYLFDQVGAKAIFATHYHELTRLSEQKLGINNFSMGCREIGDNLIFSHKLLPGAAGASFGISVAKLAGISQPILERAKKLLVELRDGHGVVVGPAVREVKDRSSCLSVDHQEVVDRLLALDLDDLSPRQAHQVLSDLRQEIRFEIK